MADSGRRYRASRNGRFGLGQRQARWREKQKVTHQGTQEHAPRVVVPLAEIPTSVIASAIRDASVQRLLRADSA
jgi:hypothetical protein